jgi:hypothetical protein
MAAKLCPNPEAHEAHMQLNGECPWCGAVERAAVREPKDWDFPDAHTIDTSLDGVEPMSDEEWEALG